MPPSTGCLAATLRKWETSNPDRQFGLTGGSGLVNGEADALSNPGGFGGGPAAPILDDGPQKPVSRRAVGPIFRRLSPGRLEYYQSAGELPALHVRPGFFEQEGHSTLD